jgi:hypothetical protein
MSEENVDLYVKRRKRFCGATGTPGSRSNMRTSNSYPFRAWPEGAPGARSYRLARQPRARRNA